MYYNKCEKDIVSVIRSLGSKRNTQSARHSAEFREETQRREMRYLTDMFNVHSSTSET